MNLPTHQDRTAVPTNTRMKRLWRVLAELATDPGRTVPTGGRSKPLTPSDSSRLAMEFDEAYTAFVDGLEDLPTESQMISLQAVDQKVSAMIGANEVDLWTAVARRNDPNWLEIRRLALAAMNAFSWSTNWEESI